MKVYIFHSSYNIQKFGGGAWLAQLVKNAPVDHGVVKFKLHVGCRGYIKKWNLKKIYFLSPLIGFSHSHF